MSKTRNQLQAGILTSIHGRRIGLDQDGFLAGPKGFREPVTAATSATTGTALPNHGVVTIDSTTGDSYVLTDPVENCIVTIVNICTGGANVITPSNATIQSSASSTGGPLTLTGYGAMTLMGVSTSLYVPIGRFGSSATAHVTT